MSLSPLEEYIHEEKFLVRLEIERVNETQVTLSFTYKEELPEGFYKKLKGVENLNQYSDDLNKFHYVTTSSNLNKFLHAIGQELESEERIVEYSWIK